MTDFCSYWTGQYAEGVQGPFHSCPHTFLPSYTVSDSLVGTIRSLCTYLRICVLNNLLF